MKIVEEEAAIEAMSAADEPQQQSVGGESVSNGEVCAVCLEPPTAAVTLPVCKHQFCYDCLGMLHSTAILDGTMRDKLPCPLCRACSIPVDILGCIAQEADVFLLRANLISNRKGYVGVICPSHVRARL